MARLSALIAAPRYPLVRYAGVVAPRSAWRKDIAPKPRERRPACDDAGGERSGDAATQPRARTEKADGGPQRTERRGEAAGPSSPTDGGAATVAHAHAPRVLAGPGEVIALAPNVLSVRHWDRLLGGALYAASPRLDWASLLRRSFSVDVLACAKCGGRLRVIAVITEREAARRILEHLGQPTEAPLLARARDPTDESDDVELPAQLGLALA